MAVEIPNRIKKDLVGIQGDLKSWVADVRWEKAEKLHITLVFLGEVPEERTADLGKVVRKGVKGVKGTNVGFSEVGFFPKTRPRVVLVEIGPAPEQARCGVKDGREEIERLQKSLAEALSNAGFGFAKLSKPHITLGRFKQRRYPTRRVDKTQPQPGNSNSTRRVGKSFKVKEVVIMESRLHPAGAIHTPIARIPL